MWVDVGTVSLLSIQFSRTKNHTVSATIRLLEWESAYLGGRSFRYALVSLFVCRTFRMCVAASASSKEMSNEAHAVPRWALFLFLVLCAPNEDSMNKGNAAPTQRYCVLVVL